MNKEEVINELKEKDDIEPDEYDGSYELVRKTVELLGQTDPNKLDYKDLDMLYLMTIGTWKSSFDHKRDKIKDSNLSNENKKELISILDKIKDKSNNNKYKHHENSKRGNYNIGMFGTGFYTFNRGGNKPTGDEIKRFINMCVKINETESEDDCITIAEKNLKEDIYGLGTASISQVLHCLKPKVFPVLNNKGIELYNKLGLDLDSPNDIT
ncbi:MAG: AAA family ATPase, partial [Bacillota bacterium]